MKLSPRATNDPYISISAMRSQGQDMGLDAETGDRAVGDGRHDRGVAELLPGGRVGDVHLDQRRGALGEGVAQGVAVVGERRRVQDDRRTGVGRAVHPAHHLGLVVGLPDLDRQTQLASCRLADRHQVLERGGAVDVGFAGAEAAQVGPVEHQDVTHGASAHRPVGGLQQLLGRVFPPGRLGQRVEHDEPELGPAGLLVELQWSRN